MLSLVHTPVKFKAIFFHGLLEASNAMVYPLSTNRSRVGALTFATLLLVGFTSCTNQYQHQADERPKASSAPDNETATVDTTAIPIADRSYFPGAKIRGHCTYLSVPGAKLPVGGVFFFGIWLCCFRVLKSVFPSKCRVPRCSCELIFPLKKG